MQDTKVMNRWLVVLGAILIQLCLGAIYAWSVFTPALLEAGWSKLQTQIVFSVGLASFAIVMVWAGRKLPLWGPQKLALLSGVTLGTGYLLGGLFGGTNFLSVILFVGIIGGAGIGIGYVVPIAVGMRWFPDKKGLITGLAVAGFGFGALLWVKLAGSWGNLIGLFGLSNTFIIYGLCFAGLTMLGGIWMIYPPEGWLPKGFVPPKEKPGARIGSTEFSAGEMLETPQFYLIFLTFAISAGAGLMSIGLMKIYPMEVLTAKGIPVAEASNIAGWAMAGFFSIANGIGRIAWGSISDAIGRKLSIIIMTATQGVFVIGFTVMAQYELSLYIGAALIGFNFGGNFALFPTITADTFGTRSVGQNYPYIFLSYGLGGIIGPILGGLLGDMQNFPLAFTICGIACIGGVGCISLVTPATRARDLKRGMFPDAEQVAEDGDVAFTFRALQDEDLDTICEFVNSPEELFYMFPDASYPLTPKQLKRIASERLNPSVAMVGDTPVGYANFIACQNKTCTIGNLAVSTEYRRKGAGVFLMEKMTEQARKEHGAETLKTSCYNDNVSGLLFFHRLGFSPKSMEERRDLHNDLVVLVDLEKNLND